MPSRGLTQRQSYNVLLRNTRPRTMDSASHHRDEEHRCSHNLEKYRRIHCHAVRREWSELIVKQPIEAKARVDSENGETRRLATRAKEDVPERADRRDTDPRNVDPTS